MNYHPRTKTFGRKLLIIGVSIILLALVWKYTVLSMLLKVLIGIVAAFLFIVFAWLTIVVCFNPPDDWE